MEELGNMSRLPQLLQRVDNWAFARSEMRDFQSVQAALDWFRRRREKLRICSDLVDFKS
jgi:hypothetical protein